jgi:DNA-binding transcriptional ArsR family regulator
MATARPYGLGRRGARPAVRRRAMEEISERSPKQMAEPVSGPVLAAISHPLRLAILVVLEAREQSVPELARTLAVREPELEQAVAVLHDAGLVRAGGEPGRLRVAGRGWAEIARGLRALDRDSRGE